MGLETFRKRSRPQLFEKTSTTMSDVLVIGGGITGASVFRDAVLRGLSATLVEAGDFAAATSSRSSGLIHGGLRYLRTRKPLVTWESCHERDLHVRLNRQLVTPEPFVIPIYADRGDSRLVLATGMLGYDLMSGFRNFRRHEHLTTAQTLDMAVRMTTRVGG